MNSPPLNELIEVLNRVTPPSRVLAHCVPTRIIRVVDAYGDQRTYRVEQLIQHSMDGFTASEWKPLSTHNNNTLRGAEKVAFQAAFAAHDRQLRDLEAAAFAEQQKLIAKIQVMQRKSAQAARGVLDASNQGATPALVTKL